MTAAIVVCDALRAAALPGVARQIDVASVVSTGGRLTSDLPMSADVAAAMEGGATELIVLSPYRGLAEDVALAQQHGLRVLLPGPLPTARTVPADHVASDRAIASAVRRWRFQPALARLCQTCAQPAFGSAVFLRHVSGGGNSVLGLWWSALESLELTAAVVGAPRRITVCASRGRGRWHASLTVVCASEATAQLVVTPTAMAGDDSMALGTGGLVWHESAREGLVEQSDAGARMVLSAGNDPWPDGPWVAACLQQTTIDGKARQPSAGIAEAVRLNLLHTLRLAARSGRPEGLDT